MLGLSTYKQDPGAPGASCKLAPPWPDRGVLEPAGVSWNLPGTPWESSPGTSSILWDLAPPGKAPRTSKGSQKPPKWLPKEMHKSMILGFGRETAENVKIELASRRQLNFQGSGTLEIEFFL